MDVRGNSSSEKRLIDANALLRHKRKMSGADFGGEFWDEAVLISDIKNAHTVDAVEVVRCRDCAVPHNKYTGCPELNGLVTPPDFYCPFGERKDGDGNG